MPRRSVPRPRVDPDLTGVTSAIADPSRLAMLEILLDGDAHPIGALARRVGVTAATASTHLRRLVDARLVAIAAVGRERQVRLANADVAELLERLAVLASPSPATGASQLRFARTCYDHLAGVLGVAVTTSLVERGWLHHTSDNLEPAPALFTWLADHDHAVPIAGAGRRPLSRACLDWSQRVPHVAGRIGAALAAVALAERWVVRIRGTRALRVTERGQSALARELGVRLPRVQISARG
jgi:DNA-binding transcriptional ArsR family regulator